MQSVEMDGVEVRPDFFIVGQPKSGSTALYQMLCQHPDIYMPELKEPEYFATDLRDRFPPRIGGPRPETHEDYLALVAHARPGQVVGEASIYYLLSRSAARNIAAFNPAARIVAILREPASLLRSLHLQLVQDHIETVKDLRTALALEDDRRRGSAIPRSCRRPQLLLYSEHVRYVEQLQRFGDVLPRDRMLVMIYDDFVSDNDGFVRNVFRFLGVDDSADVIMSTANPTVLLRSRAAEIALHNLSMGRGPVTRVAKQAVKAVMPQRLRRHALDKAYHRVIVKTPPPPDDELMAELRHRFAPEVVRLSEYLGRDLVSAWGSERVIGRR